MRKIALVAMAVLGAGIFTGASAYTNSGNITADETWGPSDGLIRLSSDVTVTSGATLTIMPGTNVRTTASQGCNVNVRGTGVIRAVGTADSAITFISVRVEFQELTRDELNLLKYCTFSTGSGHALVEFRNTTTPTTENDLSHVTIENCSFQNGGYCLVYITSGASPTFRNCYFTSASTGIFSHGSDTLTVENCVFDDISCGVVVGAYGGQFYEPMVCNIDHCTFNDIDDSREVSYLKPCKGMAICSINAPGELSVTNSIFDNIAGSGIRDWNIEDVNFTENWDITNDYNIYYRTGGDPCHLFDMGSHSQEANPRLGSAPEFELQAGSPALHAASDGSNIGAWQEPVAAISVPSAAASAGGAGITAVFSGGAVTFRVTGTASGTLEIVNAAGVRVARIAVSNGSAVWNAGAGAGVHFARLMTESDRGVTSFLKF